MLLNGLTNASLEESRLFYGDILILEDGEGPRWKFDYGNFKVDPSPDILLLGSYQHPSTGNNLVGGINLHYLSKRDLDRLANALPKIMGARNLYYRYHTGKRMVPDIFKKYYRTYNAAHIRGVEQDIMYPKYGLLKTARDWLRKKATAIFKSKAQRQKEAEPKYPQDLSNMRDRLNQVVTQLQQQPEQYPSDAPEMQVARREYERIRAQKEKDTADIERDEDSRLIKAADTYQRNLQQPKNAEPITRQREQPPVIPTQQYEAEPELPIDDAPEVEPDQDIEQARERFEQEKEESKKELLDPNNEIDLEESIVYYSPLAGRYIVEPAHKFIHTC